MRQFQKVDVNDIEDYQNLLDEIADYEDGINKIIDNWAISVLVYEIKKQLWQNVTLKSNIILVRMI